MFLSATMYRYNNLSGIFSLIQEEKMPHLTPIVLFACLLSAHLHVVYFNANWYRAKP